MANHKKSQRSLPALPEIKSFLKALLIAVAVAWIYVPVLHGGWLMDDDIDITHNAVTVSPTGLWSIWFQPGSQMDYYPVKASVQWVQWHLWEDNTFGYHLTNLVLHFVSALLVWHLLRKIGLRLAWVGGLLFAIHPTAVESVAWIAELKNTLSLPPFLLAICFYLDYDRRHRRRDYLLALGFFLLAMLAKPGMVMFPVVILLYAWWKRKHITWSDLKASAPFFVISLALGLVVLFVGSWYRQHHPKPDDFVPVGGILSHLAMTGVSISFYLWDCVWPVGLTPLYPQWKVNPPSLAQFLPWPILAGFLYFSWTKRTTWGRHALFGLGFFLLLLGPFVTIIVGGYTTFTWVMDHFLYIPIIGLIGLTVAGLEQIEERLTPRLYPYGVRLLALALALLAWDSHSYAEKFINQETLSTYELQHNPDSWLAHINLGAALVERDQIPLAIEHFKEAIRLHPPLVEAQTNWGAALARQGNLAGAIDHYQEALRINPDHMQAHYNCGNALLREGLFSEAIREYQEVLRIDPSVAEADNNWADALLRMGRPLEAIPHVQEALRLKPDYIEAQNNWGNALLQLGQPADAMVHYQAVLQLSPDNAEAHYNLANALLAIGRVSDAIAQYQVAWQLKPDYEKAHYNCGNALLQLGQVAPAMEQYQEALQINPNDADAHSNLGVGLAQLGHKPEAIEQFQEALRINPNCTGARQNLKTLQDPPKSGPKR